MNVTTIRRPCSACNGVGFSPRYAGGTCPTCHGSGDAVPGLLAARRPAIIDDEALRGTDSEINVQLPPDKHAEICAAAAGLERELAKLRRVSIESLSMAEEIERARRQRDAANARWVWAVLVLLVAVANLAVWAIVKAVMWIGGWA